MEIEVNITNRMKGRPNYYILPNCGICFLYGEVTFILDLLEGNPQRRNFVEGDKIQAVIYKIKPNTDIPNKKPLIVFVLPEKYQEIVASKSKPILPQNPLVKKQMKVQLSPFLCFPDEKFDDNQKIVEKNDQYYIYNFLNYPDSLTDKDMVIFKIVFDFEYATSKLIASAVKYLNHAYFGLYEYKKAFEELKNEELELGEIRFAKQISDKYCTKYNKLNGLKLSSKNNKSAGYVFSITTFAIELLKLREIIPNRPYRDIIKVVNAPKYVKKRLAQIQLEIIQNAFYYTQNASILIHRNQNLFGTSDDNKIAFVSHVLQHNDIEKPDKVIYDVVRNDKSVMEGFEEKLSRLFNIINFYEDIRRPGKPLNYFLKKPKLVLVCASKEHMCETFKVIEKFVNKNIEYAGYAIDTQDIFFTYDRAVFFIDNSIEHEKRGVDILAYMYSHFAYNELKTNPKTNELAVKSRELNETGYIDSGYAYEPIEANFVPCNLNEVFAL